ncbi:cupin domain-containing protein [Sphingomonas sp. BK069]|uniref:cupin domain-containing protein n=1 Tax=Sphingomonas sp. BK069 TaxID=2586979 RepID=UPI0017DD60BC|nr:cupin domain-containing protein [Sphingomonas sp. BK069]MBB3348033.1 mannose-6-phosphate isomerase-like protein (cupin superfamily) [Sphingomonas sp. BK069]
MLGFSLATLVGSTSLGEPAGAATPASAGAVRAGSDHDGRPHRIGVSATTYKVVTRETGGALFVVEQAKQRRGGPPLHVHHGEDELFYVLAGDYVVQVGDQRFPLGTGDCILGPRGVPHA